MFSFNYIDFAWFRLVEHGSQDKEVLKTLMLIDFHVILLQNLFSIIKKTCFSDKYPRIALQIPLKLVKNGGVYFVRSGDSNSDFLGGR